MAMDEKTLDKFKRLLLEQRKKLTGSYERLKNASSEEFGGDVPDINDEASRTVNRRILLEIGDKNYEILNQVDEALGRIDSGTYGICDECEEPIPGKRLELLPYALHCVECKEKLEK